MRFEKLTTKFQQALGEAQSLALARPMPLAAPVTSATLSSSRPMSSPFAGHVDAPAPAIETRTRRAARPAFSAATSPVRAVHG